MSVYELLMPEVNHEKLTRADLDDMVDDATREVHGRLMATRGVRLGDAPSWITPRELIESVRPFISMN